MAYISKIKLPNSDVVYEIIADRNTEKKVLATQEYADAAAAALVDAAPETLNTLNELAAALGDDPNFATTVTTELGKKTSMVMKSWTSADV